jgi:hypothetical protein
MQGENLWKFTETRSRAVRPSCVDFAAVKSTVPRDAHRAQRRALIR